MGEVYKSRDTRLDRIVALSSSPRQGGRLSFYRAQGSQLLRLVYGLILATLPLDGDFGGLEEARCQGIAGAGSRIVEVCVTWPYPSFLRLNCMP